MLSFYLLNAVIHEKEKNIPCTLLYESTGCRFQVLLGHTFVFGDIGLRRKKPKNLTKTRMLAINVSIPNLKIARFMQF